MTEQNGQIVFIHHNCDPLLQHKTRNCASTCEAVSNCKQKIVLQPLIVTQEHHYGYTLLAGSFHIMWIFNQKVPAHIVKWLKWKEKNASG